MGRFAACTWVSLFGRGRSADVFAIDDHWVLRRYRDGGDATAEAAVMPYLREHGYPVPRVRDPASLPRTDLMIQRLRGVLTPDGAMVIDWRNAQEGPPGLDWGMSALILAQVAVDTAAEAEVARAVLNSLLSHLDPASTWTMPTPDASRMPRRGGELTRL